MQSGISSVHRGKSSTKSHVYVGGSSVRQKRIDALQRGKSSTSRPVSVLKNKKEAAVRLAQAKNDLLGT
jgi:hypothetical protein